ncbi:hypothetical protein ZYGR_0AI07240 [Zygosaccharomyces rouxii]|uniref:ASTRA-associated protein 1 n=1 Tax=Zygosaccharomyces rouxii TaxID=4956 RepID=A0A1Q3ACS9_ZYGRO|nr:hypothetical protein ZYGR_0AI07240 [Zygosaccharomyces rouxii]
MNGIKLPEYTLRFHKSSVTDLLVLDLPQDTAPSLVSGDATGTLCLWDLIRRRPISTHCIENEPPIVALQYVDGGLLAVLDKHHKLRLFRINGSWKQVYEIPVNTLNFANFLIQRIGTEWYRLICCNTQDSESIDIYEFYLTSLHTLKRVHKGLKFYQAISSFTLPTGLKLDKLGIVMKFTEWHSVIFCGMESGVVIGFKLIDNNQVEIVYVSHVHYPNPVLDLHPGKNSLLSSSTDDKIGIHALNCQQNGVDLKRQAPILLNSELHSLSTNFKQVPVSQIAHIKKLENVLLLSSWSGETIVTNEQDEILDKFCKSKSSVEVNENPQGNLQSNKSSSKSANPNCKVSSLEGLSGSNSCSSKYVVSKNAGQRRRIESFLQNSWCIIGYDDGNIAFHRL